MGYTPHVVVVGGGVTGTGVARDLSMRGLEVTLVERGSLSNGTTGRMHGLLHSGARYATDDPVTAETCLRENRILRDVARHCVRETGGLFVELPEDPSGYYEEKRSACRSIGMEVADLSGEEARDREPGLAPTVERAFEVPDRAIDPFALTRANASSALDHGATIRTDTEVVELPIEDGAVEGLRVRETRADGPASNASATSVETIDADYVVNATGPWAGEFADLAGLSVPIRLSRGAMVVVDGSPISRVVNRCRPRQEGDIAVPLHSNCILGTTDAEVDGPSERTGPFEAVDFLIDELSSVVPAVAGGRAVRSYWGVRPLMGTELDRTESEHGADVGSGDGDAIDAGRGFAVVDHERRDGVWGLTTVLGGKLTTYRHAAEAVSDHVCEQFGIRRQCETAAERLPGSERAVPSSWTHDRFGVDESVYEKSVARLGHRVQSVFAGGDADTVLCPCEGVTRAEVRDALADETSAACDLSAVSARTRLAMGSCQGGACCQPAANELHPTCPVDRAGREGFELLQRRWAGQRPTLWGAQLRSVGETYAHLGTTLNLDRSLATEREEHQRVTPDWSAFDWGPADRSAGEGEQQ